MARCCNPSCLLLRPRRCSPVAVTVECRRLLNRQKVTLLDFHWRNTTIRPLASARTEGLDGPDENPVKGKSKSKHTILYRRDTAKENRGLRMVTAFSIANNAYFGWYAQQCIASEFWGTTAPIYVLPEVGLIGFVTSLLISAGCYTYATSSLISKVTVHRDKQKVRLWCHSFPMWNQSSAHKEYDWGDIGLDRRRKEVRHLLQDLGGDVTRFRGYLPLYVSPNHPQSTRWPLLLQFSKHSHMTVKNKDLFLEALLLDHVPVDDDEEEDGERSEPRNRGRRRRGRRGGNPRKLRR